MGKFNGKVVIVTGKEGASGGVGEATIIKFAEEGAKLTITGRNEERLSTVGKKCKDAGAEVLEIVADLAKFENIAMIIDKTVENFGKIDILINNAGLGKTASIEMTDEEMYDSLFQVNTKAPFFLTKNALPHLKKTKGCIVNVSTALSLEAAPDNLVYSMTKAALDHFARGLSADCATFGVRVNNINPAVVCDRRACENMGVPQENLDKSAKMYQRRQTLGFISSDQIAEGILFLASHPMMTGVIMPIDGALLNTY